MKVLFLTHWFPTEETPLNGVFILEHAKALKEVGVEVVILHIRIETGKGFIANDFQTKEVDGIEVVTLDLRGALWKFMYVLYPIQLSFVRKLIKRTPLKISDFDAIHSHVVHPAGVIGWRLSREYNLPHYISEHWTGLENYFATGFMRSWGRKAYAHAKAIFVVSKFLKERTSQFVSEKEKVQVVPNIVSSQDFVYRPRPIGQNLYFVMVAKWTVRKRITKRPKLLLKAIAEASKELSKPVVVGIVGDGDQVPELKRYSKKLGVAAEFHGFLNKAQIARQFQSADLFLHASNTETFSVVVAEALKCGTPTVASNVEAIPELIAPTSGMLVENNLSDWKAAIIEAVHTEYDRKAIADSFKTKFGYQEIGSMLLEAYER